DADRSGIGHVFRELELQRQVIECCRGHRNPRFGGLLGGLRLNELSAQVAIVDLEQRSPRLHAVTDGDEYFLYHPPPVPAYRYVFGLVSTKPTAATLRAKTDSGGFTGGLVVSRRG